ncbi:pyridoxamine 5'-phosphate oxidase family protein [Phytomonospora sp. NPDC050363]|uniref:pyridoxamine 5'-phosphate oxidase family protein n=1 Tax=Phytomonospora sp. NPDC050363 TaxID=3155642 RepID=UPI0033D36F8E
MIHEGEVAVQRRAGVRAAKMGSARVEAEIPEVAADFLAEQPMIVIGAADDERRIWSSALYGWPGFVTAPDERTVVIEALPGGHDPLAGLFETGRDLGMIAIEPETRRRMRINGWARREGERLVVRTDQVYSNCPKFIQVRKVTGLFEPEETEAVTGTELTGAQSELIARADTLFIATAAPGKGADASHRGGPPGFVTVDGGKRLSFPDYQGNSMYMTLGNLELDSRCGLLFWDFDGARALHVTGNARTDWDVKRAAAVPGAKRFVDVEITGVVEVLGGQRLRWEFVEASRSNPG